MASCPVAVKSNPMVDLGRSIQSISIQLQSVTVLPFSILLVGFLRPRQSTHLVALPISSLPLQPVVPTATLSLSLSLLSKAVLLLLLLLLLQLQTWNSEKNLCLCSKPN